MINPTPIPLGVFTPSNGYSTVVGVYILGLVRPNPTQGVLVFPPPPQVARSGVPFLTSLDPASDNTTLPIYGTEPCYTTCADDEYLGSAHQELCPTNSYFSAQHVVMHFETVLYNCNPRSIWSIVSGIRVNRFSLHGFFRPGRLVRFCCTATGGSRSTW